MGMVWLLKEALWEGCWHRNWVLWKGCGTGTGCCGKGCGTGTGCCGKGVAPERTVRYLILGIVRCRDGSFDMFFMRQLTSVKKINTKDSR